jgi:hypothetical protein
MIKGDIANAKLPWWFGSSTQPASVAWGSIVTYAFLNSTIPVTPATTP